MNLIEDLLDPDEDLPEICPRCNLTKPCECEDE